MFRSVWFCPLFGQSASHRVRSSPRSPGASGPRGKLGVSLGQENAVGQCPAAPKTGAPEASIGSLGVIHLRCSQCPHTRTDPARADLYSSEPSAVFEADIRSAGRWELRAAISRRSGNPVLSDRRVAQQRRRSLEPLGGAPAAGACLRWRCGALH
jgi:hypothetical protein